MGRNNAKENEIAPSPLKASLFLSTEFLIQRISDVYFLDNSYARSEIASNLFANTHQKDHLQKILLHLCCYESAAPKGPQVQHRQPPANTATSRTQWAQYRPGGQGLAMLESELGQTTLTLRQFLANKASRCPPLGMCNAGVGQSPIIFSKLTENLILQQG